jgi:hypothetical protein
MQKPATSVTRAALALLTVLAACVVAAAQDQGGAQQRARPRNDTNHEVQLHLLATSSDRQQGSDVPRALEGVVRQLRASLPPSEYRLAATLINRVKDGTGLEAKSVAASPFTPGASNALAPTILQLWVGDVRLEEEAGQGFINIRNFRLNIRVPTQTTPVVLYDDMGVSTQLTVREGEPTLVGTLGTRLNQLFVLVLTVKRAGK